MAIRRRSNPSALKVGHSDLASLPNTLARLVDFHQMVTGKFPVDVGGELSSRYTPSVWRIHGPFPIGATGPSFCLTQRTHLPYQFEILLKKGYSKFTVRTILANQRT